MSASESAAQSPGVSEGQAPASSQEKIEAGPQSADKPSGEASSKRGDESAHAVEPPTNGDSRSKSDSHLDGKSKGAEESIEEAEVQGESNSEGQRKSPEEQPPRKGGDTDSREGSAGLFSGSEDDEGPITSRKRRQRADGDEDDADSRDSARSSPKQAKMPTFSPSPPAEQRQWARSRSQSRSRSHSPAQSEGSYQRREALEYREDAEPEGEAVEDEEEVHANLILPAQSVRQGSSHWVAKLPSFLDLSSHPFDENTWDPADEDATETGGGNEAKIADEKLRSLLTTTNTVRWRWRQERTPDGKTRFVPESNARLVTWSDGSMSMQLGKELFDLHMQAGSSKVTDKGLGQAMAAPAPDPVAANPALAYLVIPDSDAQILSVRTPISGALTFQPSDVNSKTHRRLAAAVKHQRVAKVTTTEAPLGVGSQVTTVDGMELDPEQSAALEDRRLKDIERKKQRERKKAEERFEDDLEFSTRQRGTGGSALSTAQDKYRGRATRASAAPRRSGHPGGEEDEGGYEVDDFVVTDDDEGERAQTSDEEEAEKSAGSEEEEDEEAIGARRRHEQHSSPPAANGNEGKMDVDEQPEEPRTQHRRRVVIESDEE